jgi:Kef-type K+ transport system membrane component KefB
MSPNALQVLGERINQGPALAFLILTLALILGPKLAEKVRLPAMVGLVLAGMLVGPHAERLLDDHEIALSAMGELGLLYLMFAAGLELDLKLFARMKKVAVAFAVLSFAVPFVLGVAGARLLGYAWAAAVLMGSNWGSHTLVTYPIVRQMGLARNAAVATVVGATAVTDTSALLVLTGVSGSVKPSGSLGMQGLEIVVGLAVLALWTLVWLPRLTRWFFARVGGDRSYRFVFGIAAFLSGAVLAEAATIDGIVGAFFAGLGLNRAIPERSPLMERIQFFGSAWFIPIFLVSVGVLLDPRVLIDPRTLLVAFVFSLAVLGGKALAAVMAGRAFGFGWPEIGVMAGLSGSQAAATLATTLVGARLGLFDALTVNAVLVVILVSLVVTPALVTYFGKQVTREEAAAEALGSTVLVPVLGDSTRPLLGVAGRLAAADGGMVVAASVATEQAPATELAAHRRLREQAEDWLAREGLEARAVFRVARSVPAGLLQTLRDEAATLLVSEWRPEGGDGIDTKREAFELMMRSPVPILLAPDGPIEPFQRLVVVARREELYRPGSRDLTLAAELAARLAAGRRVVFVGTALNRITALFLPTLQVDRVESPDPLAWAHENLRSRDLLLLPGLDAARRALERFPRFSQSRFLVAVAAHGVAVADAERAPDLVVGRSLTEHPAA